LNCNGLEKQKAGVSSGLFAALAALSSWFFPELGRSCGSNVLFMDWVDNAVWAGSHAISSGFPAL
jgi:hypothetical protein